MAEFRNPTEEEINRLLFMSGIRPQTTGEILQRNLAPQTIKPLPRNVFQKIAGGASAAEQAVNKIGNLSDFAKLFPGYMGATNVTIPTGFNFAPKQSPTGEIIPGGLQTQDVNVNQLLSAIKPADVLGITGAKQAYTDIGMGKAPQPLDVLDVAGLGAISYGAGKTALKATRGLPVGMSIQEAKGLLQTAPRSDLGFYSAVEETALNLPRKQGSGQAFLNDLMKGSNVQKDEIRWMGLDDYLKDKPNVTRQEVQDFITNNRVDVQEVQYKSPLTLAEQNEIKMLRQKDFGSMSISERARFDTLSNREDSLTSPKFSQYTLPGGENYREIVLTMPYKEPAMPKGYEVTSVQYDDGTYRFFANTPTTRSAAYKTEEEAKAALQSQISGLKGFRENLEAYKSTHFPQISNPLAHIRVNDRIDADGKKMLLIEEVQSDWHQAGREKGYKGQLTSLPDDYFVSEMQNKAGDTVYEIRKTSNPNVIINRDYNRQSAINGAINTLNETVMGVPDAPFKDTWYQLALKRAIKYAADNGYDRIGLTTGSQQAARFDLSKQVNKIDVEAVGEVPNLYFVDVDVIGGKRMNLEVENGIVRNDEFRGKPLKDVIGKEMSDKILAVERGNTQRFEGEGLRIGGEGMKKYYDEIYPRYLDKYGKKWGSKVGETKIKVGEDVVEQGMMAPGIGFIGETKVSSAPMEQVRYLDITPEMKQSVSKGQPLFMAAPIGAGLLGTQEDVNSMTPKR